MDANIEGLIPFRLSQNYSPGGSRQPAFPPIPPDLSNKMVPNPLTWRRPGSGGSITGGGQSGGKSPRGNFIFAGIMILIAIGFTALVFTWNSSEAGKLDKEAKTRPVILSGTGHFYNDSSTTDSDPRYWVTINGTEVNMPDYFYYGMVQEMGGDAATSKDYYVLIAYLPDSKLGIEAQVYDRQGGKLLTRYAIAPDPKDGYKSALYDRYPLNQDWLVAAIWIINITLLLAALIAFLIGRSKLSKA